MTREQIFSELRWYPLIAILFLALFWLLWSITP